MASFPVYDRTNPERRSPPWRTQGTAALPRISEKTPPRKRPYAARKPRKYKAVAPGASSRWTRWTCVHSLVSFSIKQFTARDVVSRWDVVEVYRSATATSAADFLKASKRAFRSLCARSRSRVAPSSWPALKRPVAARVLSSSSCRLGRLSSMHTSRGLRGRILSFWEC